jgi:hypothetical protein
MNTRHESYIRIKKTITITWFFYLESCIFIHIHSID